MKRRAIQPDEKITIRITEGERALMLEHTFGDPEYAERLRPAAKGNGFVGEYTLDELEDILGYVAAEANHTEDRKVQRDLDAMFERLHDIQRSYDDGNWNDSSI